MKRFIILFSLALFIGGVVALFGVTTAQASHLCTSAYGGVTCPSGYRVCPTSSPGPTCATESSIDAAAAACVPGRVFSCSSCSCVCAGSCPSGTSFDSSCSCVTPYILRGPDVSQTTTATSGSYISVVGSGDPALNVSGGATVPEGAVYYNTTSKTLKVKKDTGWTTVGESQWTTSGSNIYYDITSGKVGVGTTSPGYKFDIRDNSGAGGTAIVRINQDNATKLYTGLRLDRLTAEKWFLGMSEADDKLRLRRSGTVDDLVVDTVGNVGIGTASPNAKLTVYEQTAKPAIRIFGDAVRYGAIGFADPTAPATLRASILGYGSSHDSFPNDLAIANQTATGSIIFGTGTTWTEKMRIGSNGNVTVGGSLTATSVWADSIIATGDSSTTLSWGPGLQVGGYFTSGKWMRTGASNYDLPSTISSMFQVRAQASLMASDQNLLELTTYSDTGTADDKFLVTKNGAVYMDGELWASGKKIINSAGELSTQYLDAGDYSLTGTNDPGAGAIVFAIFGGYASCDTVCASHDLGCGDAYKFITQSGNDAIDNTTCTSTTGNRLCFCQ